MKISMIIATINRIDEIDQLLESISKLNYNLSKIEVIIVDQNKNNCLKKIIDKYVQLNLKHITSDVKGLSLNRNKGIKLATGDIICFPDDDCQFLENTIKNVVENFEKNPEISVFLGKIIDENGRDCIRKWPNKIEKIKLKNFYLRNTSITLFKKNSNINKYYDENFGVGSIYGACEDADLLYRILKKGALVEYNPNIILYHPSPKGVITKEKSYCYGIGFGAFCKKNRDFNINILFVKSLCWFIIRWLVHIVTLDFNTAKIMFYGMKGRVKGYAIYKNEKRRYD